MDKKKAQSLIESWEYGYCRDCKQIRYSVELEATEKGIKCRHCGSYDLEAPAWVHCPYEKSSAVKCARAGVGIKPGKYGFTCELHCNFRIPEG